MTSPLRLSSSLFVLALTAVGLTACGFSSDDGGRGLDDSGRVRVVTSTNVWGDVVSQVGGDRVSVSSIISDPSQDPHSFEADTDTLLAISKAGLVVENGGGYDDFMDTMLDSSDSKAVVLNAVDVSGRTAPEGGELNEHVWYDLPSVEKIAAEVADQLGKLDPDHADEFTANADAFSSSLADLVAQEDAAAKDDAGRSIAITEPVPLYLTEAMGLANVTPPEFSEAVEEGDDVSVSVLKETLDLFAAGSVDALVYNEQTSGPVTEKVRAAAEVAGVAVVPVTETLPEGQDYLEWMSANIENVRAAVSS